MGTSRPLKDRLLNAVRITVAAAVVIVVFPAIDMPGGYMGGRDVLTEFGRYYTFGLIPVVLLAAGAELTGRSWGDWLSTTILSVNTTVFVPALPADPVLTTFVLLWQLTVLGARLLDIGRPTRERLGGDRTREQIQIWYHEYGPAVRHALVASLMLILAVVGYGVTDRWMALLICLVIAVASLVAVGQFLWMLFAAGNRAVLAAVAPLAVLVAVAPTAPAILSVLAFSIAISLFFFAARSPMFEQVLEDFFEFPALLILSSFAFVILVGTILLTLPAASPGPAGVSPINAFFTSTSATCVTGLIVLDTPNAFTFFGEAVILTLIQVGGLGIMVLSTFGAVLLGEGLGLRGEQALGDLLEIGSSRDAYELTRFIVLVTVGFETVGAAILTWGYWIREMPIGQAVWHGVFHAISAFCNAGFALQTRSILMFQNDPFMLVTFAGLIIVGGIGFVVIAAIWSWGTTPNPPKFGVHAKIAIWTTVILLVSAFVLFMALEWSASLQGLTWGDKMWNAFFQSVTFRTAGFNSVGFGSLRQSTIMLMFVFMFIGASPGSAGGGAKTTTIAVLWGLVRGMARGETRVVFFGRRVPQEVVYRSGAIVTVFLGTIATGFFLLALVEDIEFVTLLFEAFSAMGTVGLSLGATGELHAAGKLIVIVMMYLGRTGPLTLAVAFAAGHASRLKYSETDVMVG
ncbi:MAG: TrkH family potassium uptake protein [Bradymonadaceae bacterium]